VTNEDLFFCSYVSLGEVQVMDQLQGVM